MISATRLAHGGRTGCLWKDAFATIYREIGREKKMDEENGWERGEREN
jgi:hypothetical protein